MSNKAFDRLLELIGELERKGISYTLAHHRDETMMVAVAVPGERWEIEFFADGSVEIERFISNGQICGEEVLDELFARYSDHEPTRLRSARETKAVRAPTLRRRKFIPPRS